MKPTQRIVNLLAVVTLALFYFIGVAPAGPTEIKIAVVMPEGSTWTNTLHELADALKKENRRRGAI